MLKEIRKQPEHIREIFMWLCVVIVFSFVILAGFRQTNERLVALVNPEAAEELQSQIVKNKQQSPLSSLAGYLGDLRASITDVFSLNFSDSVQEIKKNKVSNKNSGALLPLVGDK